MGLTEGKKSGNKAEETGSVEIQKTFPPTALENKFCMV